MEKPRRKNLFGIDQTTAVGRQHCTHITVSNQTHDLWQTYHNEVLDKITKHLNDLAAEGNIVLVNDRISWKDIIDMHKTD